MFFGEDDPMRKYLGKHGYYYLVKSPRMPTRIVCLGCTAYFRTKCCRTQVGRGTHEGTMKTRFCPCCGAELTHLITPEDLEDPNQMRIEVE